MKTIQLLAFLLSVTALSGCASYSSTRNASLDSSAIFKAWKCTEDTGHFVENAGNNPHIVARYLRACPFNPAYQVAAMQVRPSTGVDYETLAEIVHKTRWGIDRNYIEYEKFLRKGPRKKPLLGGLFNRLLPGLGDLYRLSFQEREQPLALGASAPLVFDQMRKDRRATSIAIDNRLARQKTGKYDYSLWQVMIDLDAYRRAGTASSALKSLKDAATPKNNTTTEIL